MEPTCGPNEHVVLMCSSSNEISIVVECYCFTEGARQPVPHPSPRNSAHLHPRGSVNWTPRGMVSYSPWYERPPPSESGSTVHVRM